MVERTFQQHLPTPVLVMVMEWLQDRDCPFKIWNLYNFIQPESTELVALLLKAHEVKVVILLTLTEKDLWRDMLQPIKTWLVEM